MNTPTTDLRKELGAVLALAESYDQSPDGSTAIMRMRILETSAFDFLRTHGQALMDEMGGWRPIETAPHNRKLIVGYRNKLGNWRTVIATYYEAGTLELADEADETDDGFAAPGWYENTETHDWIRPTDEPPTHWRPLPPPPAQEQTK